MPDWSHLLGPLGKTLGPPETLRAFAATEPPIDERARVDGDGLLIEAVGTRGPLTDLFAGFGAGIEAFLTAIQSREPPSPALLRDRRLVRLYEVQNPGRDEGLLLYRARLRAEGLKGRASLEMWCRLPGR